jgi:hypothetical protein
VQKDEYGLRNIFGQVCVAQPSPGNPVHPAQVPPNQVGKRRFASPAVLLQQFDIAHLLFNLRQWPKRTRFT